MNRSSLHVRIFILYLLYVSVLLVGLMITYLSKVIKSKVVDLFVIKLPFFLHCELIIGVLKGYLIKIFKLKFLDKSR